MNGNDGRYFAVLLVALWILAPGLAWTASQDEHESTEAWQRADREVREAAQAVAEAGKASWREVKESSAEAWEKTKKESEELTVKAYSVWKKSKEKGKESLTRAEEKSRELWEKGQEKSRELWEKGKKQGEESLSRAEEKSLELWKKSKATIHRATAPDLEKSDQNDTPAAD